jgi:polar amino acid transport system substrate-binding protein
MNHSFCWRYLTWTALLWLILSAPIRADEAFVFCFEKADVRPWRTADGGGLNIELLNRVAKKIGVTFAYQGMPWKRCLAELKANRVNGAIGASFKADRLEIGVYPGGNPPNAHKRLNNDRYVAMRRKGNPLQWDGKVFSQLDGSIGIQLGYSIGESLKIMGLPVDEGAQRASELVLKLAAGRVAAAVLLEGEARYLLDREQSLGEQLEIFPIPVADKAYFLMLSHALVQTQPPMAARIWDSVEEIRNSPSYRKLERETLEKGLK